MPLVFKNAGDYDKLAMGDKITLVNLLDGISTGSVTAVVGGAEIELDCSLSYRQQEIIRAGGLLRLTGK